MRDNDLKKAEEMHSTLRSMLIEVVYNARGLGNVEGTIGSVLNMLFDRLELAIRDQYDAIADYAGPVNEYGEKIEDDGDEEN